MADDNSYATVFDGILASDLPDEEKTFTRLWQEFELVLGAGTDTITWGMAHFGF